MSLNVMVHPGGNERKQVTSLLDSSSIIADSGTTSREDVVTLTKSQLRAILEAIGNVNSINNNDGLVEPKSNNKKTNENSDIQVSECNNSPEASNAHQVLCPLEPLFTDASPSSKSLVSPSKGAPSKLEQKRLQWEREKAEMLDWNPWGKPGAGAPTTKNLPVASVAPRMENQLLTVQTTGVPYSCTTSPSHFHGSAAVADSTFKPFAPYNFVTQPIKPIPPVFKSSISFGMLEEDSSGFDLKKQQWLKDLDSQREEQRLQRIAEAERFSQVHDNDRINGLDDGDSLSVTVEGTAISYSMDGRTHVRGQGFKLDPASAARAEERRQKAQEYQQAIRRQMEEKQHRLQMEKEKKQQEEEEEERRLIAERARLQAEYEMEQRRLQQKKEVEEHKQTAVMSAVRKAEAEAEAEKKMKKGDKSTKSEVQTSSPRKTASEIVSPSVQPKGAKVKDRTHRDSEGLKSSQQGLPVSIEERSNESPCKELGVQTLPPTTAKVKDEEDTGYIVNRVLTPSLFRMKLRGGRAKDFGTQTDVNYGRWILEDAETTDHSNTSSICAPVGKRLTRIQHSKPYKASRKQFTSDIDSLTDRPKWGANQPSKSYIRMTDRDPHFSRRKKLQELRKQHWEREMASQQAFRTARRSNAAAFQNQSKSYPNLRLRRTKSSSDGTVGFSSSEFETSHIHSNSPRHRHKRGFRSVCGSDEDIAYFHPSSAYSSTLLPSRPRRRGSQSSDNLPSIIGGSEPAPSRFTERFSFPEVSSISGLTIPMRRKWHSQDAFYPERHNSPPVPVIQRQLLLDATSSGLPSAITHSRRKWSDQESFDLESVALSRAKSQNALSDNGSDQIERDSLSSAGSSKRPPTGHNPLVCPEVITGRPTPRQDRILQNLSSLRQGLLLKQKELENLIRHPPHAT